MRATVLVRPKPGILDPQGQAVESSLRHLGFEVNDARVGRLVDIDVATDDEAEALAQIERMCEQLLTNPLIESYTVLLNGNGAELERA
jgi:phosphoribosylformylglycinamidine synthase subunit PurS